MRPDSPLISQDNPNHVIPQDQTLLLIICVLVAGPTNVGAWRFQRGAVQTQLPGLAIRQQTILDGIDERRASDLRNIVGNQLRQTRRRNSVVVLVFLERKHEREECAMNTILDGKLVASSIDAKRNHCRQRHNNGRDNREDNLGASGQCHRINYINVQVHR